MLISKDDDLKRTHLDVDKLKIRTFDLLHYLINVSTDKDRKSSGFNSVEEAVKYTMLTTHKDIMKLITAHEDKYKD